MAELKEINKKVAEVPVKKKNKDLPKDEIGKKTDACPWCSSEVILPETGEIRKPVANVVRNVGSKYQCDVCGKMWEKEAIGKPWSEELEKGKQWIRETTARSFLK